MGMVAYGLKSGAVPALRMLLVFSFSFALAYTLKEPFHPHLRGLLRRSDPEWVEAGAFLLPLLLVFGGLMALMLRYTRESVPLAKKVDQIAGAATGVLAGLVLSGMALAAVMSVPGWQGAAGVGFDWYFAPHQYVLRGYKHLSRQIPGERRFNVELAVQKLERPPLKMPIEESGLWVASLPMGQRAYIAQGRGPERALDWKRELETLLVRTQRPLRFDRPEDPRRRRRIEGYLGRTPVLVPEDVRSALVAIETPLPPDVEAADGTPPFLWDGEVAWWTQDAHGERVLVRLYHVETGGARLTSLISTAVAPGEKGVQRHEQLMPVRPAFAEFFEEEEAMALFPDASVADRYLPWLMRGGKAVFEERGEVRILEVTGSQTIRETRRPAGEHAENLGR